MTVTEGTEEKCYRQLRWKMESNGNHDILSIAAHTVIKWYDQTHTHMIAKKPHSSLSIELMGILLAARAQTLGALTTLASKHILSTHALLRILVETHIVLMWALNAPTNEEEAKSSEVYKRFRRWDYTRLRKDKTLIESLPQTPEIKSEIEKAKNDIDKLRGEGLRELPNTRQLYEDLGSEWKEVYATHYMKYCRAVHLNRNVTQKLVWIRHENGERKTILHKDDIAADGNELLVVADMSCQINIAIRGFYDWPFDAMKNEYEELKSTLVNE